MKEREIFDRALAIVAPAERSQYLDEVCGDNERLRGHIEGLLLAHEDLGSFLQSPPVGAGFPTIDLPITEKPGTQIGPYKLLQQLGEGGMGVVYMAEQKEPVKRRVALKIIKPGMDTRQVIARFEAERQALAMMDHPNIAKVLDAGATEGGRPYFVMELVDGIPINEFCDQQCLTAKERLQLFVHVCHAVQHAHQKGIIHRDLKPSNVLVTLCDDEPVPKVIDFGVAKATGGPLSEKTFFTQHGQLIGTPEYMSPEQARLHHLDIDTRSDIYSLGVMLYELLAGESPFDRERLRSSAFDEIIRIIRDEEPPRPSARLSSSDALPSIAANRRIEPHRLNALLHGELDWIVMKAMDKDRTRRYETAVGLSLDIARYLRSEPVEARPATTLYRFRKLVGRNKTAFSLWALVGVTLLAGTGIATWQAVRASHARDRAIHAEQLAHQRLEQTQAAEWAVRQEAEKVQTEASISAAVIRFINDDLFGAANPSTEPNRDLRVREVLDRAAVRIRNRFAKQPLVQAAIHHTLGNTYKSLGAFDQAEVHLKQAHRIRSEQLGPDNASTLQTSQQLADLSLWQGRYAEAEQLASDTLAAQRSQLGASHPDALVTKRLVANCYRARGKLTEAGQMQSEVLREQQQILGEDDQQTLATALLLASCYRDEGRYEEAEPLFAHLVEVWQRDQGLTYPGTLAGMHGLAECYVADGRLRDAERLLSEVWETRKQTLGEEHYDTTATLSVLADCHYRQGQVDMARQLFTNALEVQRRVLGVEHPMTLKTLRGLANCLLNSAAYVEAEELLNEALAAQRKTMGDEHPATAETMNSLAISYRELGRRKEAKDLHAKTLEIERRTLGPEHPNTLTSMLNLATCYGELGEEGKAAELQAATLEILRRKMGPENPQTLAAMSNLADSYTVLDRVDEAAALCLQVRNVALKKWGAEHPLALVSTNNLARCYDKIGRSEEAETLYRELLERVRLSRGSDHPNTLRTASNLGSCLKKLGRYSEAEQLLTQTREDLIRVLGREDPATLTVANNLAGCYVEQQRYAEGEKLYTEVLEQRRRILGPDHPATQRSVEALMQCCAKWARSLLLDALPGSGQLAEAAQLAKRSVELAPDSVLGWSALGEATFISGDWQASVEALGKAASLQSDKIDGGRCFQLAIACWHLGKINEANAHFDRGVDRLREVASAPQAWQQLHNQAQELIESGRGPPRKQAEQSKAGEDSG